MTSQLPDNTSLKSEIVVAKFTNFPGVLVIISATKKGCDENRLRSRVEIVHGDEGEKSRKGLHQEDEFSVICADFIFAHDSYRVSLLHQSIETQRCTGVNEDGLSGADGWQPKSLLNSIWQGKPACWGLPESNRGCPGPSDNADKENQLLVE